MKPQNKFQQRIISLSRDLPVLTAKQTKWAYEHALLHLSYSNKTRHACLDCGHIWPRGQETETCQCPGCKQVLKIENTRKTTLEQREFIGMAGVDDSLAMQVNRFFEVRSYHKAGKPATRCIGEVIQHWMDGKGKLELVARQRSTFFYAVNFYGDMEIRNKKSLMKFDVAVSATYPVWDALPIYVRNGFNGDFHGQFGFDLFNGLITDATAETLFKAGFYRFAYTRMSGNRSGEIHRYWDSVKICLRNGYEPQDVTMWLDYLSLLSDYGKDLHNPMYVCPADLAAAHNQWMQRKRADEAGRRERQNARRNAENAMVDKEKARRNKLTIAQKNAELLASRGMYFALEIEQDGLVIKVIQTIQEFRKEGDVLNHCVHTNDYANKADSLILSARLNGEPVETVEVILSTMEIEQARGLDNKASDHHASVIRGVQRLLPQIKKIYKEAQKPRKEQLAA